MVDARWAVLVVQQLKAARVATDPILKKAGLTRRQASDADAKIPFHKHAALLTLAAEATGDDCYGLRHSSDLHPRQAGVLGYVLLNSSTLGDVLKHLQRYFRVLSEGWEIDFKVDGGEAALLARIVDPLVEDERQVAEAGMSGLLSICELITGEEITPIRVEFRHGEPKEAQTIRRRFGCPVRYGQDRVALVLKRELLNHVVEAADDELLKILKRHCRQVVGTRPRTRGLAFEVRELITTLLPNGQPMINDVARELGMSSRTLRRRLADQGLIYKEIVEDVRHKLALRFLSDKRINLKQVVYLLGYSDQAAFNYAFRRWTGSSPSEYRRKGQ